MIQVGAHFAEEYEDYKSMGIKDIVFIEPAKKAFHVLDEKFAKNLNVRLFNYAMGSKFGMVFLNTEEKNNGQSNSLLKPKLHLQQFPDIVFNGHERVELRTLDSLDIPRHKYNTLVMDVQGYEGEVIKGASETLKNIDTIYTEVNRAEVYEGCVQIDELDYLLSDFEEFDKSAMLQRMGFIVKQPEKLKYDTGGMPHLLWWDTDIETKVGDEVWFDYQSALQADVLVVSESGKSLPGENLDYYWVFSYQFLIVAKRQEQTIMLNGYILFLQVNEGLQSKWLELPKYINKTKGVVKYVGSSNRKYR